MPGKTQTTATQSCKWKHIKKQLKKFSPADPRQEGKACFWQENAQAVPKNTYPSVDLITLQVTHRLLENLQVQHFRHISPYLSPFCHVVLKNHKHFYWLKFTLHRKSRNRIITKAGYFQLKQEKSQGSSPQFPCYFNSQRSLIATRVNPS